MTFLWRELTDTPRRLRRHPRFTVFAVLLLAFGLGTTVATFSIAYRLLFRPLPFPSPERLARVRTVSTWSGERQVGDLSFPWYQALRESDGPFTALAAHQSIEVNRTGDDQPERMRIEVASASYFPLLGIEPVLGRLYSPAEDAHDGAAVVVVSHAFWRRHWAASPAAVGDTLRLGATAFTVIGVLPPGFDGLTGVTEAWAPLATSPILDYPQALESPFNLWLEVLGRLRPGTTVADASAGLARIVPTIAGRDPLPMEAEVSWSGQAEPLRRALTPGQLRTAIVVLLAAVVFVLLITCVNLAGLLLVQGVARRREMAIRMSLGSSRGALLRGRLWESLAITLAGAGGGLFVAAWALRLSAVLFRDVPTDQGSLAGVFGSSLYRTDAGVIVVSLAVALVVGLLFGLAPALDAARCRVADILRGGGGDARRRSRRGLGGAALVHFAEVAIALVLLIGAGLMLHSLRRLLAVESGFDPDHVVSFRLELPAATYPSGPTRAEFIGRLWRGLRVLPGVTAVSVDPCAPLAGDCPGTVVTRWRGHRPATLDEAPQVRVHYVLPDHLATLRARLVAGRALDAGDAAGAPPVVLINRTAARRLFAGGEPLGQSLALAIGLFRDPQTTAEVVGLVDDVHYEPPAEPVEPAVYVPALQFATASTFVLVRAAVDPLELVPAIRDAVHAADPGLPVFDVRRLGERVGDAYARPRTLGAVLGLFAAIATLLAAMGIYASVSLAVGRRRRELGVRMALGASRPRLVWTIVAATLPPLGLGAAAGLGGARVLARGMAGVLFGVSAGDVASWAGAASALALAALAAAYLPARRAAGIDPAAALRSD